MKWPVVLIVAAVGVLSGALLTPSSPTMIRAPQSSTRGVELRLAQLERSIDEITRLVRRRPGPHVPFEVKKPVRPVEAEIPTDAVDLFPEQSTESLLREARIAREDKDTATALQRLRSLLARDLSLDERLNALTGLGLTLRAAGKLEAAEHSFRDVIASAPAGSAALFSGHLQLGTTLFARKKYAASLREADLVANAPDALQFQVANARWVRVTCLIQLDNKLGARRELEAMLLDYGNEASMAALRKMYRSQLARLD